MTNKTDIKEKYHAVIWNFSQTFIVFGGKNPKHDCSGHPLNASSAPIMKSPGSANKPVQRRYPLYSSNLKLAKINLTSSQTFVSD